MVDFGGNVTNWVANIICDLKSQIEDILLHFFSSVIILRSYMPFLPKMQLNCPQQKYLSSILHFSPWILISKVVYRPKAEIFNLCKMWMKVWSTMKSNFSLGGTSISPNFDHQRLHPLPRTQFMRSVLRQFFPGTMNVEREEIWKYLILSDLVGCLR